MAQAMTWGMTGSGGCQGKPSRHRLPLPAPRPRRPGNSWDGVTVSRSLCDASGGPGREASPVGLPGQMRRGAGRVLPGLMVAGRVWRAGSWSCDGGSFRDGRAVAEGSGQAAAVAAWELASSVGGGGEYVELRVAFTRPCRL